jgi:hypothetical protein
MSATKVKAIDVTTAPMSHVRDRNSVGISIKMILRNRAGKVPIAAPLREAGNEPNLSPQDGRNQNDRFIQSNCHTRQYKRATEKSSRTTPITRACSGDSLYVMIPIIAHFISPSIREIHVAPSLLIFPLSSHLFPSTFLTPPSPEP